MSTTKLKPQSGDILTVWTSETRNEAQARTNADVVRLIVESHADMLEALEALPLEAFDKDPATLDAAEFVDASAEFLNAMAKARIAIAKAKGGAA